MICTRRQFIARSAVFGIGPLASIGLAADSVEQGGRRAITQKQLFEMDAETGHLTCIRTPESNDGPYYYPTSPSRRDITEGRGGVRLRLGIRVANALIPGSSCAPLPGAVVDIWQADADGMYSNVGSDLQNVSTVGQTFMRGHQLTNRDGYVEFDTVVPGWELVSVPPPEGLFVRATHIHVKVFHEDKVLTTQLYFCDDFLDGLYASVDPYRTHRKMNAPGVPRTVERIPNGADPTFVNDHAKPLKTRRAGGGVFALATIGVVTLGSRGLPSLFR